MKNLLLRVACLFGVHDVPVFLGNIHIVRIDRDRHAIEYGNWLQCPRCKKKISLRFD